MIYLDYFSNNFPWGTPGDLYFEINNDNAKPRFTYTFSRGYPVNEIIEINYNSPDGYTAKSWQPNGPNNQTNARPKHFGPDGGFTWEDMRPVFNNEFFPLDTRKDCNILKPEDNFLCNQNQQYPMNGFDERHGIIPLNLTIKRHVYTPTNQTEGCQSNFVISIEPSVIFAIDKGLYDDRTMKYCGLDIIPYNNTQNGNDLILRSSISNSLDSLTTLKLISGNDYNINSVINVNYNCKIIAENKSKIDCGDYSEIFLRKTGSQTNTINPKLILNEGSYLNMGSNSIIHLEEDGEMINSGSYITHASNSEIYISSTGKYEISPNVIIDHIVQNNSKIILNGGSLKIGDNSVLIFDGQGTHLTVNQGSTIQLGKNAKIEFKNGAYLESNGSTISSLDGANPATGLVFENAGASTITNCTFNNLKVPIYISNSGSSNQYVFQNISGNIFNMNSTGIYAIQAENTNNITVSNNIINMGLSNEIGIYFRYPSNTLDGLAAGILTDNVNINYNTINGANVSAAFMNQTNSLVKLNFNNNVLAGNNSTSLNIATRLINGSIKNNTMTGANITMQIDQSAPNILGNYMQSRDRTIKSYYSSPNLCPQNINQSSDNGWVWLGGKNKIYSINGSDIEYSSSLPLLDWGQNCLIKNSSSDYFHLYGTITSDNCYVRNNDFNGSHIPVSDLHQVNTYEVIIPYWEGSNIYCQNTTDKGEIWQIKDIGNGFYDTIYKTPVTVTYTQPEDEITYSNAMMKIEKNFYFDAISYFKMLINNYPGSKYTDGCLYSLYDAYKGLDTSSLQSNRDVLFTDLLNYLEGKIQTGNYSDEFNNTAYQIIAMCNVDIENYNEAMSGYEFISMYHPDIYIRLLASWDYAEVEALLNGSGGGISSEKSDKNKMKAELSDAEYKAKLIKKIDKSISSDPIKDKVKKSYDRQKERELNSAIKSEINKSGLDNQKVAKKVESLRKTEEDKAMVKVINVLRNSRTMTKQEREKGFTEDIILGMAANSVKDKQSGENTNSLPIKYELSQNYPNPFNPVTKINFSIPKQGMVTLKVFDMLGREVANLVNEYKQAGYYSIDFNASRLSSGIYFYKLQANDFSDIKKMVLVK